tara:strand:- start:275 stop:484 length:210 start_codon:yes stop_codon:yes gene_type:complete
MKMDDSEIRTVLAAHMQKALGKGWGARTVAIRRKKGGEVEADMVVLTPMEEVDHTPVHPSPDPPTRRKK